MLCANGKDEGLCSWSLFYISLCDKSLCSPWPRCGAAAMSIGVPIKVLHEAEGHIVTCETNTGEVYRGKLIEAEDNMNCQVSLASQGWREGWLIWVWKG